MNRTLTCGCRWIAGSAYVCPIADTLQHGVEAAEATGNVILVQQSQQALVAHWREQGLSRREFDTLMRRADAHRNK